ncbi:hypothetical protein PIB30_021194 [Stylosanthes scabra]|uniref:Uncharacterized protein n=1 Tax=Stylosanthes scabra TaxID=79078 RepID=A0ABU6U7N9_9FABA|nr:hypothetical protein [Stylosanthes scabra]
MNVSIRFPSSLENFRVIPIAFLYCSDLVIFRLLTCFVYLLKSQKLGRDLCQDVRVPRPLNEVESRIYGWVEEAVLTQPSVIQSDSLPEFRRNFSLMEDSGMEGDYVLEAAGPSDRVPFRAGEGSPHFLWVY